MRDGQSAMIARLLSQWAWPEARRHPWRTATALLAIALGVALAFSVHLVNASALSEFGAAARSASGQADFELRAQSEGFGEALYARALALPGIAVASPVVEIDARASGPDGQPLALKVLGVDPLVAPLLAPQLRPRPRKDASRLAVLEPSGVFLNAAAERALGVNADQAANLTIFSGTQRVTLETLGSIPAAGPPTLLMDIAGAQSRFGWLGRLSRIEVKLRPGVDREQILAALQLPAGVRASTPEETSERISSLSRAYRVNLTMLALVALFTGAFLVFSILWLSVAKRLPQLALLGVLGLSGRERLALVLAEAAVLGVAGSLIGLALGTGLAAGALRFLSGDLGGGYFPGVAPHLQWSATAALVHGLLGVAAALVGAWVPARMAQRIAPAQALKGLGLADEGHGRAWFGPALLAAGVLLSFAPPIAGLPLPAYVAVACLLMGGIACVPGGVALLLAFTRAPRHALALLAVQRARYQRHTATVAVAGVVASLALSVALTVMVDSFRDSVDRWLDVVLPADLYVRGGGSASSTALDPGFVGAVSRIEGLQRVETQHVVPLQLDDARPPVALIARPLPDPERRLPFVSALLPASTDPALTDVYASEAMARLYDAGAGRILTLPLAVAPGASAASAPTHAVRVRVRGVWRDYARQHGAIAIDAQRYEQLTGDARINDLAIWLAPGASTSQALARVRELADALPGAPVMEIASAGRIRDSSLRIFDRSFAVTSYLQVLAIGLGLFGVAASFSAQVLARRKEFGLLSHLGLTRAQILTVVAAEGAAWTAAGALVGLLLGLAVSIVLVDVVNPQSFQWTMDMLVPWGRLALLCLAVVAAGTATAFLAGRAAASRDAALAVKEDW